MVSTVPGIYLLPQLIPVLKFIFWYYTADANAGVIPT